jgi:Tfp pilus assembly PilM family ATPase
VSRLASFLASAPPDAAVEITPEGVSVAAIGVRGNEPSVHAYGIEPLPPGAVQPSLNVHNIPDRAPVAAALLVACEKAGIRPRRVALVIPDPAARVSLVSFDTVPPRRDDFDQLLRWQLKKSAPLPIDEAVISYSAGVARASGREFVVEMARREVIREYEGVCEDAGMHAGLVDLSTLSVANLLLSEAPLVGQAVPPSGDWLLVHMRPTYTSIALVRGQELIFFRTRAEGDVERLEDVVHQTQMYYEDRLEGKGFSRVLLGGIAPPELSLDAARQGLEERLQATVEWIRVAAPSDRITVTPGLTAALTPLVGILMRTHREAVSA